MISDSFKQDLLNRVDIVDLIERYVPLRKGGANLSACCPFHSEKTPSFTVSPSKQFYHCFGCGAHGNAISFLMEYQGLGYVDAVRQLAESAGMKMPEFSPRADSVESAGPDLYDIMERATRFYRDQLKSAPTAIEYLKGRGLTGSIAVRFGIGYAPPGWQNLKSVFSDYDDKSLRDAGLVIDAEGGRRYDRFRDRIMFPILNQRGSVIGFGGRVLGAGEPKYLNSPETALFEKGRELYGLSQARNAIRTRGRAVVVEGYMDVVALAQHGIEFSVATLGTATSAVHIQKLFRQTDEVIFCFDGDSAGRRAAWHALEVSLPVLADNKAVRFLFLPEEHDPDSFVRENGPKAFESLLGDARPLSEFLLNELRSRVDMGTLEGRSRLIAEAKPLLKRIAAPALQLQLLKQFGSVAEMSADEVGRLTEINVRPRHQSRLYDFGPNPSAPRINQRVSVTQTLEQRLLRCVLSQPRFAAELPLELLDSEHPIGQALHALAEFVATEPEATVPMIIEHFGHGPHSAVMTEAQTGLLEMQIDGEDLEIEFRHAVRRMRVGHLEREIDALRKRIDSGGETEAERAKFSQLISECSILKMVQDEGRSVV